MTSQELNDFMSDNADDDDGIVVPGLLFGSGKVVPYMGWWWRDIDFDAPTVPLGRTDENPHGPSQLVGFMANNKWYYPQKNVPTELIRPAVEAFVEDRTNETARDLYDAVRSAWDATP